MKELLKVLSNNPAFKAFDEQKNGLGNLSISEEALMIASSYLKNKRQMLIVKNNLYTAQRLYEALIPLLKDDVLLFSVEESLRVEAIASSPEMMAKQIEIMDCLLKNKSKICITHTAGYTKFLPDPEVFKQYSYTIKVGDIVNYESMKEDLYKAGYIKTTYVDQPLCYASRGGIIDVYSMNYEYPIRIEFFDNEIDSIRFFDIATKRTIKTLKEVEIIPASDLLLNNEQLEHILHRLDEKKKGCSDELIAIVEEDKEKLKQQIKEKYLNKYYALCEKQYSIYDYMHQPIVVLSSEEEIERTNKRISEENISYIQELKSMDMSISLYYFCNDLHNICKNYMNIGMFVDERTPILSEIEEISYTELPLDKKLKEIVSTRNEYTILFALKEMEIKQIKEMLKDLDVPYDDQNTLKKGIHFIKDEFKDGFIAHKEKIAVYTSQELFNIVHHRDLYANKFKQAESLNHYMDLEKGDFIVHKQYGIGKYLGIVNKEKDGIHKDYLRIVYKGNDELLIPLEQFKLIRKFVSKEGIAPKLNKLGSGDWEKTKAKVSESVKELADRLVKLYALREKHIGFAYSKDTIFQQEFENDFDYTLTDDQILAIAEIKKDMEKMFLWIDCCVEM